MSDHGPWRQERLPSFPQNSPQFLPLNCFLPFHVVILWQNLFPLRGLASPSFLKIGIPTDEPPLFLERDFERVGVPEIATTGATVCLVSYFNLLISLRAIVVPLFGGRWFARVGNGFRDAVRNFRTAIRSSKDG
jgi:hypothetical protein